MTNPEVYPITYAFEEEYAMRVQLVPGHLRQPVQALYEVMAGNIGEYEHGSADIEDVFEDLMPDPHTYHYEDERRAAWEKCMKMYSAVCGDVLMSLISVVT